MVSILSVHKAEYFCLLMKGEVYGGYLVIALSISP